MKQIPLVIGNWKMNPNRLSEAIALGSSSAALGKNVDVQVAIAPPFVYLSEVAKKLAKKSVHLAAQDIATEVMGPFTGEISGTQLRDLGVEYVIIGHSERRAAGESDSDVQKKIAMALKSALTPVVCIGERDRDTAGDFYSSVEAQLKSLCAGLSATHIKKVVIAYEPVWAIGTGKTATPADVKEMQLFLFSVLTKLYDRATANKVRLIYGGSVKPDSAKILHHEGGMQGFLVGGASLKAQDFISICRATL